jgi:hypothetical protein
LSKRQLGERSGRKYEKCLQSMQVQA